MEMNFCRRCGSNLTTENNLVYLCENGHAIFKNAAPTASVFLITPDRQVLLGRRGIEPFKGALDSIGGFVDINETIEEAAVREVLEESGLDRNEYGALHYLISCIQDYPYANENIPVISSIFYAFVTSDRQINASDDIVEIVKCPIDESTLAHIEADDIRNAFLELIRQKENLLP